jgi:hypothetical protein
MRIVAPTSYRVTIFLQAPGFYRERGNWRKGLMARDSKENILQIQLSKWHSIDLVRLTKSHKYRVVLAERFGVQRRAFVEISFEEAHTIALFLATIEEGIPGPIDSGRPDGAAEGELRALSRTTTQSTPDPTAELQVMMKAYVEEEIDPIPRPISPEQDQRTKSVAVAIIHDKGHDKGKPDR